MENNQKNLDQNEQEFMFLPGQQYNIQVDNDPQKMQVMGIFLTLTILRNKLDTTSEGSYPAIMLKQWGSKSQLERSQQKQQIDFILENQNEFQNGLDIQSFQSTRINNNQFLLSGGWSYLVDQDEKLIIKNNYPVINKIPSKLCRLLTIKHLNEVYSCSLTSLKNMKNGRLGHSSIFINNKVFVLAGVGEQGYLKSCEVYDCDQQEWQDIADMNQPRSRFAFSLLGDVIYVFGGFQKYGSQTPHLSGEKYNIKTDKWELIQYKKQLGILPCVGGSCFSVENQLYFLGGVDHRKWEEEKEEVNFDILQISEKKGKFEFKTIGKLKDNRINPKVLVYPNDQIIVFGGCSEPIVQTFKIIKGQMQDEFQEDLADFFEEFEIFTKLFGQDQFLAFK